MQGIRTRAVVFRAARTHRAKTKTGNAKRKRLTKALGQPYMQQKHLVSYRCTACGQTLTDETAFFDVEDDDAPYCEECYYEYPGGPFFGEYDEAYDKHNPTEEQLFCINCQECCKGCWYLEPGTGCVIYPHRPQYCRGYRCAKLAAKFGGAL